MAADEMRSADRDFQQSINQFVYLLIKALNIPDNKLLFVQSTDIGYRVDEAINFIRGKDA